MGSDDSNCEQDPPIEPEAPVFGEKAPQYPLDFYLKEFDTLRKEIEWMLQDSRSVERNVVIAIGLFWAFLIKEIPTLAPIPLGRFAWSIPVLFAALGSVRSWSLSRKFEQVASYIYQIEAYILKSGAAPGPQGWEHFQHNEQRSFVRGSGFVFWAILLLVTLAVAIFAGKIHPPGTTPYFFHRNLLPFFNQLPR